MGAYHRIVWEDAREIVQLPLPWEKLRGSTVLVTGATGFIGSYLVYTILAANRAFGLNCNVLAMVRDEAKARMRFGHALDKICIVTHNIAFPFEYNNSVDYIIHAACAYSKNDMINMPADTLLTNIYSMTNMLELASNNNTIKLVFLSAARVYNKLKTFIDPQCQLHIPDYYISSKQISELLCCAYKRQHGIATASARLFGIYGPGMNLDEPTATTDFFHSVLNGIPIHLSGSYNQISPRCYITDAVSAIYHILLTDDDRDSYDVFSCEPTIYEWANNIVNTCNPYVDIICDFPDSTVGYTTAKPTNNPLITLGWTAHANIMDSLLKTFKFSNF